MKVCLIVGHSKAKHCGVKDYSVRLAEELSSRGVNASICAKEPWNAYSLVQLSAFLRHEKFDIVHVQYPSIGYRASLVPHVIGILKTAPVTLVTFHEYSALPTAQQVCAQAFRFTTKRIVFVSEFEQGSYGRCLNRLGAPQTVIPIASNVPKHPIRLSRDQTILYFGQIRPNKGLESFLELARISKHKQNPYRFIVAGSAPEKQIEYLESLRSSINDCVEWRLDLPFSEVAEMMARSMAAYLPFPDGASLRRGSLLASFTNELPVISTNGPASDSLTGTFLQGESPQKALSHIDEIFRCPLYARSVVTSATKFINKYSWSAISDRHKTMYQELLGKPYRSTDMPESIPQVFSKS